MVADDHVYTLRLGIFDLLVRLDAAVKGDDQPEAAVACPVDAFVGKAVTFVVAVRDIEIHLRGISLQERIYEGYSCGSVHIIVPVHQDLLFGCYGFPHPVHRNVHILHQEWVVEVLEAGAEERACLLEGLDASFDEQFDKYAVDAQFGGKSSHLLRIGLLLDNPFALFCHNTQR